MGRQDRTHAENYDGEPEGLRAEVGKPWSTGCIRLPPLFVWSTLTMVFTFLNGWGKDQKKNNIS